MIGFSIPSKLFKQALPNNHQHPLMDHYDNMDHLLNQLKEAGVTSIEIRILSRQADPTLFQKTIQMIWEKGLQITIHGALEGDTNGASFVDHYPSMAYILKHFHRYQKNLIMTVHAFQEVEGPNVRPEPAVLERLSKQSVLQLQEWSDLATAENLPIQFAVEINRHKPPRIDPGDTIEGVLQMVEEIDRPNVGICWDMGHYYSNVLSNHGVPSAPNPWIEELPPATFLQRVIHTHIHGLQGKDETHFPLSSRSSLPLELYNNSLLQADYQGVFNLELTFQKWSSERLVEDLQSTIQRLYQSIQR